jgi:hypothetical protein
MPWPDFVTTQFDVVNRSTTNESEYYGPFNTLLITLFPPTENFEVAFQFKHIKRHLQRTIIFTVIKRKVPVFFLEVKAYVALNHPSLRKEADDQLESNALWIFRSLFWKFPTS